MEGRWSAADIADGRRFEKLKQKHQGFFASEEMRIYTKISIDKERQQLFTRGSEGEGMLRLLTKRAVALELIARHDQVCKGCPYRSEDAVKS